MLCLRTASDDAGGLLLDDVDHASAQVAQDRVEEHEGNRGDQTEHGRHQRFGDTTGHQLRIAGTEQGDGLKGSDHTGDRTQQPHQAAADAILSIDTETGRVLGGNPLACTMTGYGLEKLRTLHVWQLHPPEEAGQAKALFDKVRSDGQGAHDGLHFLTKAGAYVAIDVRASVIEFGGQRVIQRICRDVTERKRREKALERHRAFEDLVLNLSTRLIGLRAGPESVRQIRDALAVMGSFAGVDRSYVYILEDDRMSQMFVWGTDGVPAFDTKRRVSLEGFEWALERLRAEETVAFERVEIYPYEGIPSTPYLREIAERHPCPGAGPNEIAVRRHSVSVPMCSDGKLLGFLGFDQLGEQMQWSDEAMRLLKTFGNILGNALARLEAEEALMRANDELEAKVERRTRQLREKQAELVQSEKLASLGQLVAGIAHELNTPLGALVSGTRTVRRALERIEGHAVVVQTGGELLKWTRSAGELAQTMLEASDRIDRTVTSLRRFARLDRSEIAALDMKEAIDDALNLVRARLAEGVTVHRVFDDVAPVMCRAADVHQLLLNLLVNACHVVGPGGNIWVRLEDEAGGIRIEVEDDGPGIPADIMPRIFDPGFTTKGVGVGAGLGLSIAHQIVRGHQGWIRAESPHGARLIVWLPRSPEGIGVGVG